MRNLGRKALSRIDALDKFRCFKCDSKPLCSLSARARNRHVAEQGRNDTDKTACSEAAIDDGAAEPALAVRSSKSAEGNSGSEAAGSSKRASNDAASKKGPLVGKGESLEYQFVGFGWCHGKVVKPSKQWCTVSFDGDVQSVKICLAGEGKAWRRAHSEEAHAAARKRDTSMKTTAPLKRAKVGSERSAAAMRAEKHDGESQPAAVLSVPIALSASDTSAQCAT